MSTAIADSSHSPGVISDPSFDSLKDVYDRVKVRWESGEYPPDSCPPLDILIFSILHIIQGGILATLIEELILLLCSVEDTRQRTIAHAQELLHKYEAVFSKYERRDLYAIVTGTTLRRLFINALDRLAAMDILELLRSSISEGTKGRKEIADTIAGRLSLYFPDYLGIQDQPSMTHPHASAFWHYFHVDRSSSEKHEICETAKTTIDAVVNMSQLLGTSATEARLTSELDAQPHDLPSQISLTEAIEQFVHGVRRDMEMVEHMWDRLNSG